MGKKLMLSSVKSMYKGKVSLLDEYGVIIDKFPLMEIVLLSDGWATSNINDVTWDIKMSKKDKDIQVHGFGIHDKDGGLIFKINSARIVKVSDVVAELEMKKGMLNF